MTYRIVVCIDVSALSPEEAYAKVCRSLESVPDLAWETTDEWYGEDGEALPEAAISRACDAFFAGRAQD